MSAVELACEQIARALGEPTKRECTELQLRYPWVGRFPCSPRAQRQSRSDRLGERARATERGKAWTENPERSRD